MNVVDSCGWLSHVAGGPNAAFFTPALTDEENLLVPTVCILEVFKCIHRQRGEAEAMRVVAYMQRLRVVDLDAGIAVLAAKLGIELGLSLADGVILATARAHDAVIWTQDAHFNGIEGVRYSERAL